MKPSLLFICVPLVALCGCGGDNVAVTQFYGAYSGSWTSTNGHSGTAKLAVAQDGTIGGTIADTTANLSGTLSGKIASGNASWTVTYPSKAAYTEKGKLTLTSAGFTGALKATSQTDTYKLSHATGF